MGHEIINKSFDTRYLINEQTISNIVQSEFKKLEMVNWNRKFNYRNIENICYV